MNLKRALTNAVRALDKARDLGGRGNAVAVELDAALVHILRAQGHILLAERATRDAGGAGKVLVSGETLGRIFGI